jgi:hypothetical protein
MMIAMFVVGIGLSDDVIIDMLDPIGRIDQTFNMGVQS